MSRRHQGFKPGAAAFVFLVESGSYQLKELIMFEETNVAFVSPDSCLDESEPDVFDLPVHPLADCFAMMNDEELDELAEDITAHGLHNPLIVSNGQLLDGRNRREGCRRAKV